MAAHVPDASRPPPSLTPAAGLLLKTELKRLADVHARARDDARLLTAAGGVAGFVIGRQTAATFLPGGGPRAAAALGVAGLAVGAAGVGYEAVRDRAALWDRETWHPAVRAAVEAQQLQRGAGRAPPRGAPAAPAGGESGPAPGVR